MHVGINGQLWYQYPSVKISSLVRIMRKLLLILLISGVHLFLCKLISVWVLAQSSAAAFEGAPSFATTALVWTARILYFPIVTLAVFPREYFPGLLVNVPIVLNSLIWGGILGMMVLVVFKRRR